MTETAASREAVIRPHLDQAREKVARLQAAVQAAERRAHDAYVAGDVAAGHAAHDEATQLKRELEQADAGWQAFEQAALAVAEEKQKQEREAQLARARQAHEEAVAEAQRRIADIRPALTLAKRSIKLAQQAEDLARNLEREIFETEVALGLRERGRVIALTNRVQAMLESQPYLRELLHLDV